MTVRVRVRAGRSDRVCLPGAFVQTAVHLGDESGRTQEVGPGHPDDHPAGPLKVVLTALLPEDHLGGIATGHARVFYFAVELDPDLQLGPAQIDAVPAAPGSDRYLQLRYVLPLPSNRESCA